VPGKRLQDSLQLGPSGFDRNADGAARVGEEHQVAEGVLPPGANGAPIDVANLVLFLASDESRFITGAEFVIDNGVTIRPF